MSNLDPARKYGTPEPTNKNNWTCKFCSKVTKGGVFRLKQHLVGGFTNATSCRECPEDVRAEIKQFMMKKAEVKASTQMMPPVHEVDDSDGEEYVDCELNKSGSQSQSKKPRHKGPLDRYVTSTPPDILKGRKDMKEIFGVCVKEQRERVCRSIARWIYDDGIAFNAVSYDSFREMVEAIGIYGPGLKPPSMHELRVPLLKKEVESTLTLMEVHKKEWVSKGCSIMSDGWRDSVVQKDIIKFLVNSPRGSVFLKSEDVSEVVKDATLLYKKLDDMVLEVGETNVVQVVTDNASNYVKAGKLLMNKRPHLYWSPCAAHCIDLILEDIGKIPQVKGVLKEMHDDQCIYLYPHFSCEHDEEVHGSEKSAQTSCY